MTKQSILLDYIYKARDVVEKMNDSANKRETSEEKLLKRH